jgi:hypothetical protein
MASPTVLSVGAVSITANGGYTGDLLAKVMATTYTVVTVGPETGDTSPTIPAAPAGTGPFELVIQPGYTGSLSIPSGVYAVVINGATADSNALFSSDPNAIIIGSDATPLNYTGGALTVIGGAGGGTVTDTADGATLAFTSGSYDINASGNGDNIYFGSAASGTGAASAAIGGDVVTVSGTNSTVTATSGADTIYASGAGTNFNGTGASSSQFIGTNAAGAFTVASASNQTIYGGAAGGSYTEGADSTGSFFFVPSTAGSSTVDTVFGSASSPQAQIWTNSQNNVVLSQSGSALTYNQGNQLVDFGDTATIDASGSRGGDNFVIWNTAFSGGNFAGNTTLVGSSQGNELFGLFDTLPGISSGTGPAHTITIQNWVSTDVFETGAYGSADLATANAALAAAKGGTAQFTLSDGTTVKFEGSSPTSVFAHY